MPDEVGLEALRGQYNGILDLTAAATSLLTDPGLVAPLREAYARGRFIRVEDVLPAAPLTTALGSLAVILAPVLETVIAPHTPSPEGALSYGGSFRRVDPARLGDPAIRATMELLLERLGFTAFGAALGERLAPLIRSIVGDVDFRRAYLYVYEEGDYIGAHDDSHVGNRIDVQFPVSIGASGGIRVLSGGLLRMQYDRPGTMNILGPAMWHDVPPLLRAAPDEKPRRINLGLRFTPD